MLMAVVAAALAAVPASPASADRADEDLAAVRKAVAGAPAAPRPAPAATRVADARPPAEAPAARPARPAKPSEGRWLRVRVTERAGKHAKVVINLPLGLARAFGEDWPVQGCSDCGRGRTLTLGDVLRALDAGQTLVEIDDDEASIRVWVD